jgi:hypothetical protein
MIVNTTNNLSAYGAPTQYVDANGRRLAFRSIGEGTAIVLCTRFRGNMDLWDPLFLDSLAAKGFRVICSTTAALAFRADHGTTTHFRWRAMRMTWLRPSSSSASQLPPHHQYPIAVAECIAAFVRTTGRTVEEL